MLPIIVAISEKKLTEAKNLVNNLLSLDCRWLLFKPAMGYENFKAMASECKECGTMLHPIVNSLQEAIEAKQNGFDGAFFVDLENNIKSLRTDLDEDFIIGVAVKEKTSVTSLVRLGADYLCYEFKGSISELKEIAIASTKTLQRQIPLCISGNITPQILSEILQEVDIRGVIIPHEYFNLFHKSERS